MCMYVCFVIFMLQQGRPIETVVSIVDFENLSRERHFYLPGLELLKQVTVPEVVAVM